jgi:hypothetical protein
MPVTTRTGKNLSVSAIFSKNKEDEESIPDTLLAPSIAELRLSRDIAVAMLTSRYQRGLDERLGDLPSKCRNGVWRLDRLGAV